MGMKGTREAARAGSARKKGLKQLAQTLSASTSGCCEVCLWLEAILALRARLHHALPRRRTRLLRSAVLQHATAREKRSTRAPRSSHKSMQENSPKADVILIYRALARLHKDQTPVG